MKKYLMIWCVAFSVLPFELSALQDENAIFYECYARSLAGKFESSRNHCQCQNDMALKQMSPTDWDRYSKDYDAFRKLLSSASKFEPNSYGKSLALINDSCIACKNKNKNYKGCLRGDSNVLSPEKTVALATNLRYGQFDLVASDAAYSQVFLDVISTYSDHCRAKITKGTRYWTEDQNGQRQGGETIVDYRYTEAFEKHGSRSTVNFVADAVGGLDAVLKAEMPDFGFGRTASMLASTQALQGYVGTSCLDQSPLTRVYENLYRYEQGQPPLLVPGGEKERISWRANDSARLQALVEFHKQDKAAQDAKRVAEGPLRCKLEQTKLARGTPYQPKRYQGEDHGGSYTLQLNQTQYEMVFYPYSMVRDYGSNKPPNAAIGFGYEPASGCSYNVRFQSGNSIALKPTRESNKRNNNSCAEVHGYVEYGAPGEPVKWAPRYTVDWPNLAQYCEELSWLRPSKLSAASVAVFQRLEGGRYAKELRRQTENLKREALRKRRGFTERQVVYEINEVPDSFWRSLTR